MGHFSEMIGSQALKEAGGTLAKRQGKIWILCLLGSALVVMACGLPGHGGHEVNITWQEEGLAANILQIPLEQVLEHLAAEEAIWFNVHKSVAHRKISVSFENLTLEQALGRILAGFDYSVIFDRDAEPAGVVVVGDRASRDTPGGEFFPGPDMPGSDQDVKSEAWHPAEDMGLRGWHPAQDLGSAATPPQAVGESDLKEEDFKVIRDATPPEGAGPKGETALPEQELQSPSPEGAPSKDPGTVMPPPGPVPVKGLQK